MAPARVHCPSRVPISSPEPDRKERSVLLKIVALPNLRKYLTTRWGKKNVLNFDEDLKRVPRPFLNNTSFSYLVFFLK